MKTFCKTILAFSAFLAFSGVTYADDEDRDGGLKFKARLTADQEVPENPSDATGDIKVEFDKGFTKLEIKLTVSNTMGTITRAHFHCNRAGANGQIAFGIFDPGPFPVPMNATSLEIEGFLTNADFNNVDCNTDIQRPVNNLAALAFAMRDGLIYANVHTSFRAGGEVRGQMIEVKKDHKDHNSDHRR
jgi:hypothetical protein